MKPTKLQAMTIVVPDAEELASVFEDNFRDGETPRFTEVHAPGSGGRQFSVHTIVGETTMDAIEGVVLGWFTARALYMAIYDARREDVHPDCISDDGMIGTGEPGGQCAFCSYSQWQEGERRSPPACKTYLKVLIAPSAGGFPLLLRLPPTGLSPFRQYRNLLAASGLSLRRVITRFALEVRKGEPSARIVPTTIGLVEATQHQAIFDLHSGLSVYLPAPIAYPPALPGSVAAKAFPAPLFGEQEGGSDGCE